MRVVVEFEAAHPLKRILRLTVNMWKYRNQAIIHPIYKIYMIQQRVCIHRTVGNLFNIEEITHIASYKSIALFKQSLLSLFDFFSFSIIFYTPFASQN